MAGNMVQESATGQTTAGLTTSREPKGPVKPGAPGTIGDQALIDSLAIIVGAWILLALLGFSLRKFNI